MTRQCQSFLQALLLLSGMQSIFKLGVQVSVLLVLGYQCLHTCESEETAVKKCSVGMSEDQQRPPLFASGSHNTLVCVCRLALRAQQLVASNSRQRPQPTYRTQEWDGLKMVPSTKTRRLRSVAPCLLLCPLSHCHAMLNVSRQWLESSWRH